jgi:hypothetical protein
MALDRLARTDDEGTLARVRGLAWLFDRAYLDPILGLVLPGVGDLIGSAAGMYTVGAAIKLRVAPIVIARMLLNLATDAALGVVPIVGDVGDVVFRAHRRNLALLEARATHRRGRWTDWLWVLGALALLVAILVLVVWLVVRLLRSVPW